MHLEFEWDEAKNKRNIAKHGIDFVDAVEVFYDPYRIYEYDAEHSDDEDRWRTIGLAHNNVLFVVYTEPRQDTVRIISTRKANRHEQDTYYSRQAY